MYVNNITLVGNMTKDIEIKPVGDTVVGRFSIAVNSRKKNGNNWVDEAHFFDVEAWGQGAKFLNTYAGKGSKVSVVGKLKQDRWEKDGQKHSRVLISADTVGLLSKAKEQSDSGSGEQPPF